MKSEALTMIKLWHLPLNNIVINSPYGMRNINVNNKNYWWHNGLDLKASPNTPIYAVSDGIVMVAKYDKSYGYYTVLDHGKYSTLYAHLSRYIVAEGSSIKAGHAIGYSGNTGDSTGPHLHFEIRLGSYDKFWDRAQCDRTVFMNTLDPMLFINEYTDRQKVLNTEVAINIVQSTAKLEDKTMEYLANHYKYGEDLVKKLAKTMI